MTTRRIDPPDCGCTDCQTGYSVPLDQASDGQRIAALCGFMADATGGELLRRADALEVAAAAAYRRAGSPAVGVFQEVASADSVLGAVRLALKGRELTGDKIALDAIAFLVAEPGERPPAVCACAVAGADPRAPGLRCAHAGPDGCRLLRV